MRSMRSNLAFTLVELLAVIGIIAVLGVVITTSAQRISRDARLASGTNQVISALGTARGIAIRDRATVLVAFTVWRETNRATPTSPSEIDYSIPQRTEIVIAKATGQVVFVETQSATATGDIAWTVVVDRAAAAFPDLMLEEFEPVGGMSPILLPVGIKVAGSAADIRSFPDLIPMDELWLSQPVLACPPLQIIAERGTIVVVRFAADGSMQTRNPALSANLTPSPTDFASVAPWIDFERDGLIRIGATGGTGTGKFYTLDEYRDESLCDHAMFLAVFDDDRFHQEATPQEVQYWRGNISIGPWLNDPEQLNRKRTDFINQFCDRIHFNRFTGVAEVHPR